MVVLAPPSLRNGYGIRRFCRNDTLDGRSIFKQYMPQIVTMRNGKIGIQDAYHDTFGRPVMNGTQVRAKCEANLAP